MGHRRTRALESDIPDLQNDTWYVILFVVFCRCVPHRYIPTSTIKSSSTGATRRTFMLPPTRPWVTSTRSLHLRLRTLSLPRSLVDYPRPQLRCDNVAIARFRCTRFFQTPCRHEIAHSQLDISFVCATINLFGAPQNLLSLKSHPMQYI